MVLGPTSDITPTITETIRVNIEQELNRINTCLPAKVVKYNVEEQKADVKIQLLKAYDTEEGLVTAEYAVIPDVPVVHPRAGDAFIHLPIEEGDHVMLVFAQRSLDNWKSGDAISDPADRRKFNLTDAYAIPGGYPFVKKFTVQDPKDIEIINDSGRLSVKPDGKFQLTNGTDELVAVIEELIKELKDAQVLTMGGPQGFLVSTITKFEAVRLKVEGLKG